MAKMVKSGQRYISYYLSSVEDVMHLSKLAGSSEISTKRNRNLKCPEAMTIGRLGLKYFGIDTEDRAFHLVGWRLK